MDSLCMGSYGRYGCIGLNLHIKSHKLMGILWAHTGTIGRIVIIICTMWLGWADRAHSTGYQRGAAEAHRSPYSASCSAPDPQRADAHPAWGRRTTISHTCTPGRTVSHIHTQRRREEGRQYHIRAQQGGQHHTYIHRGGERRDDNITYMHSREDSITHTTHVHRGGERRKDNITHIPGKRVN